MEPTNYWRFEDSLNEAIDNLITGYRAAQDVRMFFVSNVDCGGAVARLLYTEALNDIWLWRHFNKIDILKERPAWIIVPADLADLAKELVKIWGDEKIKVVAIPTLRQLHRCIFYFPKIIKCWRMIRDKFSKTISSLRVINNDNPIDVICFAHHRKFIGLMRPILLKTGLRYAFMIQQDHEIISLGLNDDEAIILPDSKGVTFSGILGTAWPDIESFACRLEVAIAQYNPRLFLYCEGDAWYQDVVSRIGKKHAIKSACIQWGAFPYQTPRTGLRNLACSVFLAWGDFFVNQLTPFNNEASIIAIGHPCVDIRTPTKFNKSIAFLLNTDPNGKSYGLDGFHDEFWKILLWTAMHCDDWRLIVRPHPAIPLSKDEISQLNGFANIEIHDPADRTLSDSLINCDLAVTVSSSSVIEGVAFGVVPLIFNPSLWRFQPDFESFSSGFECKSMAEAINLIQRISSDQDFLLAAQSNLLHFRRQLFIDAGVHVQAAIANLLLCNLLSPSSHFMASTQKEPNL